MANEATDSGLQSVSTLAPKADAYSDLEQSRKDLVEQQKRLMLQLEERSKPQSFDFWASLAKGFGDPNAKTFSQGIGSAAGNIQALNEQKKAQEIQTAQMRMAVAQSMLEQQGLASVANALSGSGEPSTTGEATAGMTTPQRSVFNSLSPQDQKLLRYRLLSGDKTALRQLSEQAIKDTGTPDSMKIQSWNISQFPPGVQGVVRKFIAEGALFGSAKERAQIDADLTKLVDDGVISSQKKDQLINSLKPEILTQPVGTFGAPVGTSGAPSASAPISSAAPSGVSPKQERELKFEAQKTEQGAAAKGSGEQIVSMMESHQQADDVVANAREAASIAASVPNAFKLLTNKDSPMRSWYDGVLAMARQGVQTPWGSISIPTDIAARSGLTDLEIQGLQNFARIEAQFTLFNRRTWLKGQGAISNGESSVAAQLGPQGLDRPEVIRMKAQALEEKAKFDKAAYETWLDFKENTGKGFERFLISSEFKSLSRNYVDTLDKMREANAAYLSGNKSAPAQPGAPRPTEGLQERLDRIRKERGG